MPRRTQGPLKIIRKDTITNAIYQIQNGTKNSKIGNGLQVGPKMGGAFLHPLFSFFGPGELPLGGPIVVYNYSGDIYAYKNIKQKLHKSIAAIWFNKTCRGKDLKPNYINIRINGNNRQWNNTMKAAIRFRINQEIKFLYIKKLNEQLYRLHLNCANY
jgi:hypothetical protein